MSTSASDFSAPPPLAGWMLRVLMGLMLSVFLWAFFGRLDIVALADGKLVPSTYLKIVQPAEQGIVKEILVKEGERVEPGQVLIRMDSVLAAADLKALRADYDNRRLWLRRIDAQLAGKRFAREGGDPAALALQVEAQYAANVRAYENALAQERSALEKSRHDLEAARQTKAKLEQVLPHYVEQEKAFEKLTKDGFAGRILYTDKRRERIEKEQDLRTQEFAIEASRALIEQSEKRLAQISADYRRQLQTERVEVAAQFEKLAQELAKLTHRHALLELRAPQAGIVKDLATHTAGTVAAPGTILMTLVPEGDKLVAEVWVSNQDVGFVRPGQEAKLKLAAFQFHKYGMVEGKVIHVNADATEAPSPNIRHEVGRERATGPLAFRALVELGHFPYPLQPGMQVAGEIHLGTRTVLEYLLSPVQKAFHEAARER
jgi:HlyD family secretion protein